MVQTARARAVVVRALFLLVLGVGLGLGLLVLLDNATRGAGPAGDVAVTQNVEYGRVDGVPLRLDVYRPRAWTWPWSRRPAVLLIHGGGWIEGDKAGDRELATHLAGRGFIAIAVNYRLALRDQDRYPAAVLDVRRAVRWVRTHAAELSVDPARVGAVGHSAGGHLVALLGTTDDPDPADPTAGRVSARVACVVDSCGPTDFTDDAHPPVGEKIARVIPMFFGQPRAAIPAAYHAASPALRVDRRAAPTLIFHGADDDIVPIEQSRKLERALHAAGVAVRFVEYPGEGHGFVRPENFDDWIATMTEFLVAQLDP